MPPPPSFFSFFTQYGMSDSPPVSASFVPALFSWFSAARRPLPWRVAYSPYHVLISETMLQQTQMERGVAYFLRWIERFPTIFDVANAHEEDILHAWEGLGYYRRARLLHATAKAIVERHHGEIPQTKEELLALPGIGEYTAAAILGIAHRQDTVTVDANVLRVFSRLFDIADPVDKPKTRKYIEEKARAFLPQGQAREYNEALMEFGALMCRKVPKCTECPLTVFCLACLHGTQKQRPVLSAKASVIPVYGLYGVLRLGARFLVRQRPENGLWAKLWEFPGFIAEGECPPSADAAQCSLMPLAFGQENSPQDREKVLKKYFKEELGLDVAVRRTLSPAQGITHTFTNHALKAHFFELVLLAGSPYTQGRLVEKAELEALAMPAFHRKALTRNINV